MENEVEIDRDRSDLYLISVEGSCGHPLKALMTKGTPIEECELTTKILEASLCPQCSGWHEGDAA